MADVVHLSFLILLGLSIVPVLDRTVVAGDPAVNLCLFPAYGAGEVFTVQVAVFPADGVGGRQRIVRKLIIFCNGPYQLGRCLPVGQLFAQERMEHRTGGIQGLQLVLDIQGVKHIRCIGYRKVGAVCIIGRSILLAPGGDDIRIFFLIVSGQTIGGGLRRSCLQVVQIAVLLLVDHKTVPHMVQHILCKPLGLRAHQILPDPPGI